METCEALEETLGARVYSCLSMVGVWTVDEEADEETGTALTAAFLEAGRRLAAEATLTP